MEEWKQYRLGDICSIYGRIGFRGYTTEDLTNVREEGAISLSPTNIVAGELDLSKPTFIKWDKYYESPEIMIRPYDIVIVKTGSSVGRTTLIREVSHPMTLNPQLVVLKDLRVNPIFLSYLIKTREFQGALQSITVGSAIPTLSQKNLANLQISIPSDDTQNRISGILNSLDKKILLNNRINHNLEEQARSLYKSWFIDFEPFKDGKFVDSELGMIPEGWHIGTLSEIADITMGQSPSGSSFNEDGHGIVFYQGRTEFGFRFPSIKLFTTEPTRFAEPHSVLMSVRAPVGDINVALDRCCIGRGLAAITAKDEAFPFVLYTLKGKSSELDLYNGEGTVFGSINRKELEGLSILIPPRSIIQRFNDCIKPVDDSIEIACKEIVSLSYSRDSILPKLMSGQLPLDELDC